MRDGDALDAIVAKMVGDATDKFDLAAARTLQSELRSYWASRGRSGYRYPCRKCGATVEAERWHVCRACGAADE